MKRVWQNAKDHSPKPMTMLAALFRSPEQVEKMDIRLKVSREEKNLALFLVKYRRELCKREDEPDSLKPFTDFIIDVSFFFFHSVCTENIISRPMWSLILVTYVFKKPVSQTLINPLSLWMFPTIALSHCVANVQELPACSRHSQQTAACSHPTVTALFSEAGSI